MATTRQEPDRTQLVNFVTRLEGRLNFVVNVQPQLFIRSELVRSALALALDDLAPTFQVLRAQISAGEFDSQLPSVGLSGPQLAAKISIFILADNAMSEAAPRSLEERTRRPRAQRGFWSAMGQRMRRWLDPLLGVANAILGSLAKVTPLADPIQELKEAVEAAVKLPRARRPRRRH